MNQIEKIESAIYVIRGHKVMLDSDLARLYGVPTFYLNQQVRRNKKRFPNDFMFQVTAKEMEALRLHFAISKKGRGGRRYPGLVFTEHGVAMLSSVLNSEKAIKINIQIMRTFTRLRQLMASNADLAKKIDELEKKYDSQFQIVFKAIRKLWMPVKTKHKRIGFTTDRNG
jgi:hypothetical protein